MNRLLKISFAAVFALTAGALLAQESIVGKYSGRADNPRAKGGGGNVDLVITSVDDGIVKGTSRSYTGNCAGEYPLEGKYEHPKLELKGTKAGRTADCIPEYNLTVEGKRLVGTNAGGLPIQFSR
jgi:hypothetical protein